jgi:hypothetical protein
MLASIHFKFFGFIKMYIQSFQIVSQIKGSGNYLRCGLCSLFSLLDWCEGIDLCFKEVIITDVPVSLISNPI